ncbi:MAG: hypothetical protein HUK24_05530 [Sphaerochaetaceae bacterium]|nr:hypothetical protein [Sphaerochaetaceae bacterium]
MKKLIIITFVLLLTHCIFGSYTYEPSLTEGLPISAFVDSYCTLGVTELLHPNNADGPEGMPFSIKHSSIAYNSSDVKLGRKIGTWLLATNGNSATIKIMVTPLVHVDNSNAKLDYFITFMYEYYNSSNAPVVGYIVASSKLQKTVNSTQGPTTSSAFNGTGVTDTITLQNDTSIVTAGKDIRFMLDGTYNLYDTNLFPLGSYSATVSITVEGV